MATVGQVYYNVLDTSTGGYISSGVNIFSDIVNGYRARKFNKLGIQAPPGTQAVLNNSKTIMIGRTGMYELDEDIEITNMYFVRPRRYRKDVEASDIAIEQGTNEMINADNLRKSELADFYRKYPSIPDKNTNPTKYEAYWNEYNEIQNNYIKRYQAGLNKFNQGKNGIYILYNPNNVNDPLNYEDLYNIIVDFLYE